MKIKNFRIEELVSEEVFKLLGDNAWKLFDEKILKSLDAIRTFFNAATTVNTWLQGGKLSERGFRSQLTPVGALHSQHRKGEAFDINIRGYDAEEIRQAIIDNRSKFPFITRMEKDVGWVHFDCKETNMEDIYLFKG